MALSAQEQARMAQLEQEVGHMVPSGGQSSGLSPEEHQRMQQLEQEVGHLVPQNKPADHWYDISGRGLVQGTLDALPTIGGVGGGILAGGGALLSGVGAPAAGLAGVGGAGLGAMGGQNLKSIGERYLLGKKENVNDMYENLAMAGQHGAEQQMAGGLMNEAAGSFANSGVRDLAKSMSRPGAGDITAAAARLNVKPTQGMLTDDYTTRNLENSLSQSPSIPGSWVRNEQRPISEAINNTTESALADASQQSDYEAGRGFKKGAADYFQGRYEPIQKSYEEIESHTSNIPLNEKGLSRIANNIRGMDEAKFEGSEGNKIASQFADWMENAENVNDLKTLKTKARLIAQDPNSSYEAKSVASSIMGKLEQAERNSVMRQAVQIARESPIDRTAGGKFLNASQKAVADQEAVAEGEDIGRKLIGDIKSTNKQYRGLMEDARTFGKGTGLTKADKGMSAMLNDIEQARPEEAAKALFDQNNVDFMKFAKEKMPEQFEAARQQKLAEVLHKTGGDPGKLLKLADKMGPEARGMLFGEKNVESLADANTLLQSVPKKVGASDTPRGLDFHDLGLMQNVRDIGRYGLLKAKPKIPAAAQAAQRYTPLAQGFLMQGMQTKEKNK